MAALSSSEPLQVPSCWLYLVAVSLKHWADDGQDSGRPRPEACGITHMRTHSHSPSKEVPLPSPGQGMD